MTTSSELQNRISKLTERISHSHKFHRTRGKVNLWMTIILMLITLLSSAFAGIGGIFLGMDSRIVGALALIPGVIALGASTMKFQGKSDWHYRKATKLDALKRRLLFELPEVPNADNIAAISSALTKVDEEMQNEWEEKFILEWAMFLKPR